MRSLWEHVEWINYLGCVSILFKFLDIPYLGFRITGNVENFFWLQFAYCLNEFRGLIRPVVDP